MKLALIIFTSLLVAVSASLAQAFTPPYSIAGAASLGTLTIQTTGSCKIRQTYENAKWGAVRDSLNAVVGTGVISAAGELLILRESEVTISGLSDPDKNITRMNWLPVMNNKITFATLASLGGCNFDELVNSAKSRRVYRNIKGKADVILDYRFNGVMPATVVVDGNKETYKQNLFKGRILFRGKPLV